MKKSIIDNYILKYTTNQNCYYCNIMCVTVMTFFTLSMPFGTINSDFILPPHLSTRYKRFTSSLL